MSPIDLTADLVLTQGDTAPGLAGNVNANLTGASAVAHIKRPDRTVLTKTATVTDGAAGAWLVNWSTGDLSLVGEYAVEIEVTFAGGEVETFVLDGLKPVTFRVRPQYA